MRYKSFITSAAVAAMSLQGVFALPSITVESVVQRWPWNNFFDITYTISGDGGQDIANFNYCKVIFTATIPGRAEPVVIDGSSDVVAKAENGTWTVTWTNAPAGVKAENCTMVASLYRTTGDYMVVDLDTGAYAFDDLADGDTPTATPTASNARYNTRLYKTDRMVFRRVPRTSAAPSAYSGGYPTGHADYTTAANGGSYTGNFPNSARTWRTDKDFFVGLFELTRAQYAKLGVAYANGIGENGANALLPETSHHWIDFNGGTSQSLNAAPMNLNNNDNKKRFLCHLKVKTGIQGFTMPTEVMWEIAARAGATTVYPWGDTWQDGYAVYAASEKKAVGTKTSNAWGIFDMIGNVAEFTLESYAPSGMADMAEATPWTSLNSPQDYRRVIRGWYWASVSSHGNYKTSSRGVSGGTWDQANANYGLRVFYIPQ
jgi:formylglycine-generating enzyme required for sulfatase activity